PVSTQIECCRRERAAKPGNRTGAGEGGSVGVGGDGRKPDRSAGLVVPRRMECLSIILQTFALRPETAFDRRGRPPRALILMAIVAGVARLELVRKVRAGNAEAVIVPLVDHHEGALGHMAGDASERRVDPLVMGVRGLCVSIGVTLQADLVA